MQWSEKHNVGLRRAHSDLAVTLNGLLWYEYKFALNVSLEVDAAACTTA